MPEDIANPQLRAGYARTECSRCSRIIIVNTPSNCIRAIVVFTEEACTAGTPMAPAPGNLVTACLLDSNTDIEPGTGGSAANLTL